MEIVIAARKSILKESLGKFSLVSGLKCEIDRASMNHVSNQMFQKAADAIRASNAILITAGAGMSVDSGLPDFRGPEGFWKAYPPLKKRGLTLPETSNPRWFESDPHFAWGFFGHRYNLYSNAKPHKGFEILKKWGERKAKGCFVFTSNVDGHFQKSGFPEESVLECHGSINYLQLVDSTVNSEIWKVPEDFNLVVRESDLHAEDPLPQGPLGSDNKYPARPNILMFGDWGFVDTRSDIQDRFFHKWLYEVSKDDNLVVIEIGSGTFVPTVRMKSEQIAKIKRGCLIRINPREPEVPKTLQNSISFPMGGLDCLSRIDALLS